MRYTTILFQSVHAVEGCIQWCSNWIMLQLLPFLKTALAEAIRSSVDKKGRITSQSSTIAKLLSKLEATSLPLS